MALNTLSRPPSSRFAIDILFRRERTKVSVSAHCCQYCRMYLRETSTLLGSSLSGNAQYFFSY